MSRRLLKISLTCCLVTLVVRAPRATTTEELPVVKLPLAPVTPLVREQIPLGLALYRDRRLEESRVAVLISRKPADESSRCDAEG